VKVDADGKLWKDPSSKRYKKNIRKFDVDAEKISQLDPVRFNWKTTGEEDIGLIAEDVENVIPDLVIYDNEGKPDAVKYDKVAIYLLQVVKELEAKNEQLEKRIEDLESIIE
jgi:alpha-L-fucosidase